ncbi:hypothetical protein BV20DRAFT_82121 [Pilatotrama ljubarskyi]|nr:hypothetical protein BV20DRAFT_82121 [Pilatotrama ljubarskyi]
MFVQGLMFLLEIGFTAAVSTEAFITPDLVTFRQVAWLSSAAFGICVASDVLVTATLIWVLRRSRTGFKRTDTIIEVLITYSICTGLVTDRAGRVHLCRLRYGHHQVIRQLRTRRAELAPVNSATSMSRTVFRGPSV